MRKRVRRWLARQFARPTGLLGKWLIGPGLDRIGRAMSEAAFERLHVRPGDRILEVGFGGGELSKRILGAGAAITGVDISEAMVARARRRFRNAGRAGQGSFITGAAEALPVAAGAFDKAVSVNAIYFWHDLAAVMAEFARVLRPGGILVLCFQTPEAVRRWPGHRHGFVAYEPEDVLGNMAAAGIGHVDTVRGSAAAVGKFLCVKGQRR